MSRKGLPLWKIKRELLRVVAQGDDLMRQTLGRSVTHYVTRFLIDPKVRFVKGELTRGKRVAVYLIFPSRGLLASHRVALDYIVRSGYSPVVVSNLPLSDADQADLRGRCSDLILRPNFGYDFGGYRDAMRLLAPEFKALDYLALFNDSSWFPVRPDLDWLRQAEDLGRDFVGSVCHEGLPARRVQDFSTVPWVVDIERPNFHYGSYSLLIAAPLLASPGFAAFWRRFSPTNNKQLTVRRGEIGLTRWVIDNGFSHGALCPSEGLDRLLDALPAERLREIAVNLIDISQVDLAAMRSAALAMDRPDHATLRNTILAYVAYRGPGYALQDFDTRERAGNFIKKAPMRWSHDAAEATLRLLERCPGADSVFLNEARETFAATYGKPGR